MPHHQPPTALEELNLKCNQQSVCHSHTHDNTHTPTNLLTAASRSPFPAAIFKIIPDIKRNCAFQHYTQIVTKVCHMRCTENKPYIISQLYNSKKKMVQGHSTHKAEAPSPPLASGNLASFGNC